MCPPSAATMAPHRARVDMMSRRTRSLGLAAHSSSRVLQLSQSDRLLLPGSQSPFQLIPNMLNGIEVGRLRGPRQHCNPQVGQVLTHSTGRVRPRSRCFHASLKIVFLCTPILLATLHASITAESIPIA